MSQTNSIVNIVEKVVSPMVEEEGVNLWDVVFEKEGGSWFLRVYLDGKNNPVTIDNCEHVSRALSKKLDELDPIEQSYYLEVSSAGLGRRLTKEKHIPFFIGKEVTAKRYKAQDGKKELVGILLDANKENFLIEIDGEKREIERKSCAYIKLNDDKDLF